MPRGYDSRQPQSDWNPTASKISFDTGSVAKQAEAAFQAAMQNFWQYTVEAFDMAIGIDPSTFLPTTQTQLGGFGTTTSILAQLISAGGGNSSASDLLTEYANTFKQAVSSGDWSGLLSSLYNETTSALSTIWPGAVPGIDASKITSGTFAQSMITGLTTTLNTLLPTTTYQNLVDGIANALGHTGTGHTWSDIETYLGIIPGTNIGSAISAANVPGIDASKITSGAFAQSMITGLTTTLNTLLPTTTYQNLVDGIANSLGHTGTGHTWSDIETYLGVIPGTNIGTAISAANVPGIDASKIISGLFGSSLIPNISAGTGNGQSADLLTHLNAISAATGSTGSTALSAATQGMQLITNTLSALSAQMQQNATQSTGATNSGQSFGINFNQYSIWGAVPVNTSYSALAGAGTQGSGQFTINSNGQAAWNAVSNGDVSAIAIFNGVLPTGTVQAYTDTDYQKLQASLGGLPNGVGSRNYAVMRANAITNPSDFVYGVVYLSTSYALMYEVGCYIGGTKYIWEQGTVSSINLNFTMIAGVGNNPNRYQGYSGAKLVFDWTNTASDPGGLFPVGATHRYWGFQSTTYNGGQVSPAPATYVGCADNSPPTVPGSGIRMYRTNTASAAQSTATGGASLFLGGGSAFFDTVVENSADISPFTGSVGGITAGAAESAVQVANAGRYLVSIRSVISAATCGGSAVSICPAIFRSNSAGAQQEIRYFPSPGLFINGFGSQYNCGFFGGSEVIACQAGDILVPGFALFQGPAGTGSMSALSFTGEGTGGQSYFEVTLANWSFN